MINFKSLTIVGIAIASIIIWFSATRSQRKIADKETAYPKTVNDDFLSLFEEDEPTDDPASLNDLFIGPPDKLRAMELSRRAIRPINDSDTKHRSSYDVILNKEYRPRDKSKPAKPTEAMPTTSCISVEPVPNANDKQSEAMRIHHGSESIFISNSGFGFIRMLITTNSRGIQSASEEIERVELVSLLTHSEVSAYVLEKMATPARARKAKRRPLDEFETLGLEAVRKGEELVWTPDAPTRMFGAIRARAACLDCHVHAKEGDLLGAFTYYLNTPVNELGKKAAK